MCEHDWRRFRYEIAPEANERLTAILESFSEHGDYDLPKGCFRWFSPGPNDPPGTEFGAFEARGVVVHGRRASIQGRDAFFVISVEVDDLHPVRPKRRRLEIDERQRRLPLEEDT